MASLEAERVTVKLLEEALIAAKARVQIARAREGDSQRSCLTGRAERELEIQQDPGSSSTATGTLHSETLPDALEDRLRLTRAERAASRQEIGLSVGLRITWPKRPITTIMLCLQYLASFIVSFFRGLLWKPWLWMSIPVVSLWVLMKVHVVPDQFSPPVCGVTGPGTLWQVEMALKEVAWWVLIGILSSVGLGNGMHTGRMFLFPHLMQVVHAAEGCRTTEGLVAWYQHPCKLDCSTTSGPKDGSTVTLYRLYLLVIVQCILWGIGSALGELPPYAIARAARLSSNKASAKQLASLQGRFKAVKGSRGLLVELEEAEEGQSLLSYLKAWTIHFIEKHGFFGVLLLASWPNAMFDMCGMCCGLLAMPLWTFLVATLLGKGIIKAHLQAFFLLNIFGADFFPVLLSVIQYVNGILEGIGGIDSGLRQLAVNSRGKLIRQFELQTRIKPELLFDGSPHMPGGLTLKTLSELYGSYDDSEVIAARVFKKWDKNKDGMLSLLELQKARSKTDSKISLGTLDPGQGDSWVKMCWEISGVLLQVYYILSMVDELARAKQLELDQIELAELAKVGKDE